MHSLLKMQSTYNVSNSRVKYYFEHFILPDLLKQNFFENIQEIPQLDSLQIHMGLKEGALDENKIAPGVFILSQLANQKAYTTKSQQSIANFKLREGMTIGAGVTLKGEKMFSFLDRFIFQVLSLEKDPLSFINYHVRNKNSFTLGFEDVFAFSEIETEYDKLHALASHRRDKADTYGFELSFNIRGTLNDKHQELFQKQTKVFLTSLLIPLNA